MATSCGFESHRPHQPSLAERVKAVAPKPLGEGGPASASYGSAGHVLSTPTTCELLHNARTASALIMRILTIRGEPAMINVARASLVAAIIMQGAVSAHALEGTFTKPLHKNGPRLDNCENFGTDCGQPAADHFCRVKGYQRASQFETERASPTRVMTGKECRGPGCVGFRFIACFTSGQRGRGLDWPTIMDN